MNNGIKPSIQYLIYLKTIKMTVAIIVGNKAYLNKPNADTPLSKYFLRIETPTGFGEFAIIVSPPPDNAPVTNEYFRLSEKSGTKVPRYVSAALSLKAVNPIAVILIPNSGIFAKIGLIHQACNLPCIIIPAMKKATNKAGFKSSLF